MPTAVRSFSKINLGLVIGPNRPDGFHALSTLYQTLALHDVVEVAAVRSDVTEITLASNHRGVPLDERNTAWKMVAEALERMGVTARVHIHIQKDLPVQGGMGAGSANAAAALLGLERELGQSLPAGERLALAAAVGSDVPLFLVGGAVLGLGRGEEVYPMPDLPETHVVIVLPERGVSTPQAFRDWDALWAGEGTGHREQGTKSRAESCSRTPAPSSLLTSTRQADRVNELSHTLASAYAASFAAASAGSGASGILRDSSPETKQGGLEEPSQSPSTNDLAGNPLLSLVHAGIENDFEQVVFPQYPLLRDYKRALLGTGSAGISSSEANIGMENAYSSPGCLYAALSGSGSALFGLYGSQADAEAAQRRIQSMGVRALVTKTIPRGQYWDTMFAG